MIPWLSSLEEYLCLLCLLFFHFILRLTGMAWKAFTGGLPPSYEDQFLSIYFRTRYKIGKWLEGQILLSLSMGIVVFIGLSLLGVKYSLVLAILAAVLELVPFVGPIISGAIAVLFALSQSQAIAIYVLIFFVVVQKLETTFLTPTFMR